MRTNAALPAVAVSLLAAAAAASAAAPPIPPLDHGPATTAPEPDLVASVSSAQAGARPVSISVRFPAVLVCGRPRGPVTVTLPPSSTIPHSIAASAVRVTGSRVARVTVAVERRSATIVTAAPAGVMCHSVTTGTMSVVLTPAAGVGNPTAPGAYAIVVRHGSATYRVPLRIT